VQVAFAPDGRLAYVSLNGEDAVGKIDVRSRKLAGKVKAGDGPVQLVVTPDGRRLLVANQGTEARPGKTLSVIDTATFRKQQDVVTGTGAHGVAVDPTGARAYVTNVWGGDVAVVDLRSLRVVDHVRVGKEPNGISFSPLAPAKPSAAVIKLPLPSMPGMDMG
jgi:YVTN family beta-propeller protein